MTKSDNGLTPSVDISTARVTNGPIEVNQQFVFSTNASGNISVTAPTGPAWFSPSPAYFTGPGSVTVTAELVSAIGWGYHVTGMNVSNSNPHVPVGGAMPATKAS
jgi:hypothetical protein